METKRAHKSSAIPSGLEAEEQNSAQSGGESLEGNKDGSERINSSELNRTQEA